MDIHELTVDRSDDRVTVVTVGGEHDIANAQALKERFNACLDDGVPLAVDLSPATFIDSSVLGVLIEARSHAHRRGLGFSLSIGESGSDEVRRVFEVTGLAPVLPVHRDRQSAIEEARSGITIE